MCDVYIIMLLQLMSKTDIMQCFYCCNVVMYSVHDIGVCVLIMHVVHFDFRKIVNIH